MKTILATAYAINPYKGSEDGMGWNFILQMARFQNVIAITRENNKAYIDKYMAAHPHTDYSKIQFLYFDLPYWMRFWKKGSRGAMLYYLLWQRAIIPFIKKQALHFDIAHNLNFHNDWTPSYLWKLNKPFVWGPIGHHPLIPKQYLQAYAFKHVIKDRLTWLVKKYFWNVSRSLQKTVNHANYALAMNSQVAQQIKLEKNKTAVIPSVATEDAGWIPQKEAQAQFTIISAGRFVPLKGFDLTILSFAQFIASLPSEEEKGKCELILVGNGPEKEYLKELVKRKGIAHQVRFIDWIERTHLMAMMKQASVFLFPSHEGAGMVVAEALSFGLPIICLDNEGPGEFINDTCGFAIAPNTYENTVSALAQSIQTLYHDDVLQKQMSMAARKHFEAHFNWNVRGEQLKKIYQTL